MMKGICLWINFCFFIMIYEFEKGGFWNDFSWNIEINAEIADCETICKHCHSKKEKTHKRIDGSICREIFWTCPKVVVTINEDYKIRGICLDCIIEANETLKQK